MLHKNKTDVKDIYLDDGVPIVYLDTLNEANFRNAYQKFNQDISQKYSIDPKILDLEKKIDAEFQDRKFVQAKINEKLEEERNLQNKYNDLFAKKSHVTPPYYKFKNEKSALRNEPLYQQESNSVIINKSTQTNNQQAISQLLFNNSTPPLKNNPDFNLNRQKVVETKNKYFNSERKKTENIQKNSPSSEKIKTNKNFSNLNKSPKKTKTGSAAENFDSGSFFNEISKVLLEAKSLIIKKRLAEAEKILQNLIRKEVNHADLFYLMGETQRLQGL